MRKINNLKNKSGELKITFKNIISDTIENSTSHGIPKMAYNMHIGLKIMWAFFLLASTASCVYFIIIGFISYYQYNTYISSSEIQEIPSKFPAISICNSKFINKVAATDYINSSSEIQSNLASMVPWTTNLTEYGQYFWKGFFETYILQATVSRDSNLTTTQKSFLGFQLSDMLLVCRYNWVTCSASDFSLVLDPLYGNCYTYNSGKDANGTTVNIQNMSVPGANYGLSIELFTGDPALQSKYEYKGDGFVVFVHNQSNPSLLNSKSILVPTGTETNLKIKKTFTSRLSSPYGNCLLDVSATSIFSSTSFDYIVRVLNIAYTQEYCYSICLESKIVDACGCNSWYSPSYGNQSLCGYTDNCWKLINYLVTRNNLTVINDCVSQCPLECNSVDYGISTSSLKFPNRYYRTLLAQTSAIKNANISLSDINDSVLRLNIFYETLTYTNNQETASIDAFTIMSNFGGTLGLFLGVSFLSFVELFELIYRILHAIIENKLQRNGFNQMDSKIELCSLSSEVNTTNGTSKSSVFNAPSFPYLIEETKFELPN